MIKKNEEILLTIIIPVYNTESYIKKCLDSIVNQINTNVEIILIDDGSQDKSADIISKFSMDNSEVNIKYIAQTNQGQSIARNNGLKIAKGKYIWFIDSDDYIYDDTFKSLLEILLNNEFDVLEMGFSKDYGDESRNIIPQNCSCVDGKDYLASCINGEEYYERFPWKYIFNKTMLIEGNYFFPVKKYEDLDIIPKIIYSAKRVCSINVLVYNYIMNREGATTSVPNVEYEIDKLETVADNIKYFSSFKQEKCEKDIINNLSKLYYSSMLSFYKFEKSDQDRLLKSLRENKKIISYTTNGIQKYIKIVINILGIKNTIKLMRIVRR